MDTKRDDLTGQEMSVAEAWKLKITNPATKLTLEIDCKSFDSLNTMIQSAIGNGQKWFKWVKNETGSGVHKSYPDELSGGGQ